MPRAPHNRTRRSAVAKGDRLGEFELIVLAALLRLEGDAYGMAVRQEIEAQSGRTVAIGSVYKTLERLKRKAFVECYVGDPTPVRGGRAKQYFRVTGAGRGALETSVGTLGRMIEGLELGWSAT